MSPVTGRLVDLLETYQRKTRDPATVALAVVPLVLVYGLGLLQASGHARAGADVVSDQLLARFPVVTYVGIQLGVAVLLVVFALFRRQEAVGNHVRWAAPSVAEACVWGGALGAIVLFVLDEATLLGPVVVSGELVDRIVLSAGAGLHEELVFRLLLVPALTLLLERTVGLSRGAALTGAGDRVEPRLRGRAPPGRRAVRRLRLRIPQRGGARVRGALPVARLRRDRVGTRGLRLQRVALLSPRRRPSARPSRPSAPTIAPSAPPPAQSLELRPVTTGVVGFGSTTHAAA